MEIGFNLLTIYLFYILVYVNAACLSQLMY